ncbi:Uncharacterised protein [Vibrio cholerae]|nr:Uncharacterised protein [Vibrio cholerae]CSI61058.1 Uncharacterised protein [Vibrio cholerae]CSI75639.1 Uncharacterised protein [Vibrio cholerae]
MQRVLEFQRQQNQQRQHRYGRHGDKSPELRLQRTERDGC